METIGQRISRIIADKCGKKVTFARDLKIDQSYVTQLENGRRNPSERLVDDICRKYGVNREWLLEGEGEPYQRSAEDALWEIVKARGLGDDEYNLIAWFVEQPEKTRRVIMDAIVGAAERIGGTSHKSPPTPHDLTDEEMYAELSRQLAGERESREKGTGTSGSGLGSCGTG